MNRSRSTMTTSMTRLTPMQSFPRTGFPIYLGPRSHLAMESLF
jgi:hypothetical protein